MRVNFTTNIDDVFRDLDSFAQRAQSVAVVRTLNTLAGQADVAIRRSIRDIYGIATSELDPYFDVQLANATNPSARIVAKGKGFALRLFHPKQTAAGVEFTIKGRRVTFPHAFFPKGALSGNAFARGRYGPAQGTTQPGRPGRRTAHGVAHSASVFRASGETFSQSFAFGFGRLPIQFLRSASPPDALGNPDVIKAGQNRVDEQAAAVFKRELSAVARGF
jgi:hypothetical protein